MPVAAASIQTNKANIWRDVNSQREGTHCSAADVLLEPSQVRSNHRPPPRRPTVDAIKQALHTHIHKEPRTQTQAHTYTHI